jgi:hypothetical protein
MRGSVIKMFVHSTVTTVVGVVLTEVNTGNDPPSLIPRRPYGSNTIAITADDGYLTFVLPSSRRTTVYRRPLRR